MGDHIGNIGIDIDGFMGVHGGLSIGERSYECYHNFVMQGNYASPTNGLERLTRKKIRMLSI